MKIAYLALLGAVSAQLDNPDSSYDTQVVISWRDAKIKESFQRGNQWASDEFNNQTNQQMVSDFHDFMEEFATEAQTLADKNLGTITKALKASA